MRKETTKQKADRLENEVKRLRDSLKRRIFYQDKSDPDEWVEIEYDGDDLYTIDTSYSSNRLLLTTSELKLLKKAISNLGKIEIPEGKRHKPALKSKF